MGARLDPTIGFGLFESRNNPDTLAATGAGANDSAYTEAGPIPGHPEPTDLGSRWRPMIRGAQSVSLSLLTLHGGYPGREVAAGVAYRLATDSAEADYRSWEEPNLLTDWTTSTDAWGSAVTWDEVSATLGPLGLVYVVARSGTDGGKVWSYNPRTEVWTDLFDFTSNPGLSSPIAIVYDEELGRLIILSGAGAIHDRRQIAYMSDDNGVTFTIYSRGQYNLALDATTGSMAVAVSPNTDWLAALPVAGGFWAQAASSDRGISWDSIDGAMTGTLHHPIRTSSGWLIAYARTADSFGCVRLIGSPRALFDDAAEIVLTSAAISRVVGCRDHDGCIYLYMTTAATTQVWISYDDGASWARYTSTGGGFEDALSSVGVLPTWRNAVPSGGSIYCIGRHGTDTQWHACRFGGWSNVEQTGRNDTGPVSIGPTRWGIGATPAMDYIALEFPDTYGGWTRLGSAGTRTMSGTDIGFQISCTQAQQEQYQSGAITAGDWACGAMCHYATGQGLGGTAPTFNSGLYYEIYLDNGTNRYTARIELASDGIRTHDGTTQRSSTSITMTAWTHIRWFLRPAGLTVWYRQAGSVKWTRIANDVTITAAATVATGCQSIWGHNAAAVAGTSVLGTRYSYITGNAAWRHQLDTVATSDNAYTSGVLGLAYGRRVPGRGAAYPIPEASTGTEEYGLLTAVGGPTHIAETVSLPADHTYDLDHIYPALSPSPRVQWRSTADALTHITWDQGSGKQAWFGGALALAFLNAQPRTAVLEIDDNAGGWTTLGTLDKGWGSINYTLTGTSLAPRAATATIDRYIHEGELVGGYVICSTAGTSVARRIIRNSGGYWSTSNTLQQVRIGLDPDEVDGTETASGTGEIVHHSGVMVVYRTTDPPRRRLRIRIAASQITPGGYYAAGIAAIARVVGVGNAPAWGWNNRTDFSRTVRRAADGTPIVRENGPPRRIWSRGWPDGVQLQTMRLLASDAPRIEVSTFAPIGTKDDAWTAPVAWLEHTLESGEQPALMFPQLPTTSGTTITDPSGYLYGSLESDGVGMTAFAGKPGTDEVVRVDSISFEEIR